MQGQIHAVIMKLATLCNLDCSYCYVYHHEDKSFRQRPKFISDNVFERSLAVMAEYCARRPGHGMAITFHGGEPTLIGAERFDKLAGKARTVLGDYLTDLSIQTNATLIDDEWIDVFKRHDVQVGVSLDGPQAIHDMFRVDHAGRGSYRKVVAGIQSLQNAGLSVGLLCVVNPLVSGLETFRHFRSLGIQRMNFLLPDATHDSKSRLYGQTGPTPVADYLIPIFDDWFDRDDPRVKISLFTDLLRLLMGGEAEVDAFGNMPMSYIVIETDGSIEGLDVLRVCKENIARSGLNVMRNGLDDLRFALPVVYQAIYEGFPLAPMCRRCRERDVCGGGYLPHRYATANGFDNPSVWCADILKLLRHVRKRLRQAAAA